MYFDKIVEIYVHKDDFMCFVDFKKAFDTHKHSSINTYRHNRNKKHRKLVGDFVTDHVCIHKGDRQGSIIKYLTRAN